MSAARRGLDDDRGEPHVLADDLTLAAASSQYSSRLIRDFVRDRVNQFVLGYFVGLFGDCLVVLTFFIHHIAESIQAATILRRITGGGAPESSTRRQAAKEPLTAICGQSSLQGRPREPSGSGWPRRAAAFM